MEIKTNVNKWDLIKLKTFVQQKLFYSNYEQGEKTPSESEKIIANETTDKGLISKVYKLLRQVNTI